MIRLAMWWHGTVLGHTQTRSPATPHLPQYWTCSCGQKWKAGA